MQSPNSPASPSNRNLGSEVCVAQACGERCHWPATDRGVSGFRLPGLEDRIPDLSVNMGVHLLGACPVPQARGRGAATWEAQQIAGLPYAGIQ